MTSLAIFGAGRIGGAVAHLLNARGLVHRIVLADHNTELLQAQRLDIAHTGLNIDISTDNEDICDCDIVICTAGLPRNPSIKTRADLLKTNLPAAKDCAEFLHDFQGVLIAVTNPMDIITWYLHRQTGISREKIIGFGGQLDSARFIYALRKQGISGEGVILGEHGEHQIPVFSQLEDNVLVSDREEILNQLKGASMEIIKGKGATEFGPAWHISELVRKVLTDSREVTPCSCILDGEYGLSKCSLGVPAMIGRNGICAIQEWDLDSWEQKKMEEAGSYVSELCTLVDKGGL
ncbi:MAG TPA: NAD(P)-binding domain-containing protein [Methanospirillum sp.]|nr:NAD(P)-binding domain-containing protein [Methanospirillum sp.]